VQLSGLHFLLTYQCTFECDHCFAWGSPWQSGTFTLENIRASLRQAADAGVTSVYFEGGEPFLYYATLLAAVRQAHALGLQVGIVSNTYWATSRDDALEWLRPLAGLIGDLSISSDLFHFSEQVSRQSQHAQAAAEQLGIPIGVISIARPEADAARSSGQLAAGESGVMYRGRAAEKLAGRVAHHPWDQFTTCPHEDLREPGRVHVDPFGNLHVCQGISLGNMLQGGASLREICASYSPEAHPIVGPLLAGGPAELARRYDVAHEPSYADACHLCYESRRALRERFPDILTPDQVYGIM
jgi:hypothetical protein